MNIELHERTAQTVITYFQNTRDPEVRRYLPMKATTEQEAIADFEKTLLPDSTSYGKTIYVDSNYIGDIWAYCIGDDDPNAMLSFCIFDISMWGKGIATKATHIFMSEIKEKYGLKTLGAFALFMVN